MECYWEDMKHGHVYEFFFFFQAEDGIRDLTVTGVQTCALPICGNAELARQLGEDAGPLGVNGPFEMLDLRPFAVSRHSFQWLKRYVGWHASRCDVLTMQRFNVSTRLFYKHRRPIT